VVTTLSEQFASDADAGRAANLARGAKLTEAARELAPKITAVREAIERERELSAVLVDAMGAAGMFSLWLPKSLGGPELNAANYVRVIEELSRIDGSVGWCASVASAYSCIAGYLQPDVARKIYGGGRTVVAGAVKPSGKAFIVDGGYRVTGHWAYGSGIRHSTWTLGNCVVHDRDGPRNEPNGPPEMRLVIFPTAAAEVIDTWRVSGLRGTGSHDYCVADLFVPEDHTIPYPVPPAVQHGLLYAVPLISGLALAIAAVPLGIARAAIDAVIGLATEKTPHGSRTPLRDKPTVQADVARAEALLGSARSYLIATVGELWKEVAHEAAASLRRRAMVRLACAYAAQASAEAVDVMYNVAGGTALYETGRLERCFRDVHACTQHIATSTGNYELGGRVLLGLDLETSRL
jgi:alkylation response protein AidB-like acyl-CoA dehydrogenase